MGLDVRRRLAARRWSAAVVGLLAALALSAGVAACGDDDGGGSGSGGSGATKVTVLAFKAPSLGAFIPAVIESRDIDAKHGLDLQFSYTTPDNYNAEFAAGHAEVGGSAALLSEALRSEKGAKSTYLFNLFNYYGAVVTQKGEIGNLPALRGHTLAAATGTTNYAMFQWFARQQGLDLNDVERLNQTTAGLSTMALSGRADATQLWEPAYSSLVAQKPDIKTLDMGLGAWEKKFRTKDIPYLGVAATTEWARKNPKLVTALYATYKEAADWIRANPADAAKIITATLPGGKPETVQKLIKQNDRLQLAVTPAQDLKRGIDAVFAAGLETGYLKEEPPSSIVYQGQL